MVGSMQTWQMMTDSDKAGTTISRHVGELEPLTTDQYIAWQGDQQ